MNYSIKGGIRNYFKFIAVAIVVFSTIITAYSLIQATNWINKPFPGFLLYRNLANSEVGLSHWTGRTSGIKSYDIVLEINKEKISSSDEVYRIVNEKPIGSLLNYKVSRNGEQINLSIPTMEFKLRDFFTIFGIVYLVGVVFFITGIVVYYIKPDLDSGKIFLVFCFWVGAWFTSIFETQSTYTLYNLPFLGLIFWPTLAINLSFIFPSERSFYKNNSWVVLLPYSISFLLSILHFGFFNSPFIWVKVESFFWLYILIGSLIFLISTIKTYSNPDSLLAKERALVILLGAFLGFCLPAFLAVIIVLFKISNLNYLAVLVIFFPSSIAYAIVKHKLFDIDIIIQKALVYGTLTGALVGVFALMVLAFNVFFVNYGGWKNPAFFLLLTTFLVFALNPLKDRIQSFIDVTFFRTKYDYRKTIEEISFAMTSLLNLDEITDKIIKTIEQTMFSNPVSVVLFNQNSGGFEVFAKSRDADFLSEFSIQEDNELIKLLSRYRQEVFKEDLSIEEKYIRYRTKLMKTFNDLKADLFVPILFKKRLIGILSLGEKKSSLSYSSQDIKLLHVLANQSAIAIENASAFRLVEDYAKKLEEANREIRETQSQLVQVEKMSAIGQLAAGIAHEIRNPLNIIEGARYYLSQLADGENAEVQKEYLEYIKHEIDRTNRLIDNLLKFSKSEPPHFESVNVNAILENALVLIRKQLSDNKIKLMTTFNPQIPNIMGDPNQLWQVFINIMINAVQAMPQGGDLHIDTGFNNGFLNNIFVSFSDTGGGIDEDDLSKIFDPFFTRKETGTGLGLSISYKIVENHNGRIIVASKKGEGATFVIEFSASQAIKGVEYEGENTYISG